MIISIKTPKIVKMKIILEQDQVNRIVFKYLDKKYKDMKPFNPPGASKNYIQFIDNNGVLLMDGIIGQELLVGEKFWNFIKDMFGFFSDYEVKKVIEKWTLDKFGYEWDGNISTDDMII